MDRAVVVASIEAGREVTEPRQVAFVIERPGQALDEGIRIVDVRFRDGTALPNDVIVALESFLDGIEVELDRALARRGEFAHAGGRGISAGSKDRTPMTSASGISRCAARSPGSSAGSCCPSASMVMIAGAPWRSASANPLRSAAPLPRFSG